MKAPRKEDIPLAIVGCDFREAPTLFREKLVMTPAARGELFQALQRVDPEAGFMALETCNRVEWFVTSDDPAWLAELLKARMLQVWTDHFPDYPHLPAPACHVGSAAVAHALQVVAGLESLAVGEAQIAGQFQDALNRAQEEKTTSPLLNRFGSAAGRLAKTAYRIGFRSNHRQGVHGLAVTYLLQQLPENRPLRVAVAGMGSIGRKAAHLLAELPRVEMVPFNRTIRPEHQATWRPLDELPAEAARLDALVLATGSLQPVLTREMLDGADRRDPLLMMDIGIPRQVHPDLQADPRVAYRNIDDLLSLPREEADPAAAGRLQEEIRKEQNRFTRFCLERDMSHLLDRIHQGRQQYIHEHLPLMVDEHLLCPNDQCRRHVVGAIKKCFNEYANEVHQALQNALEEYWSQNERTH
jgi:glutamyl-tRNA reductase